jgi:hypothetical protein
MAMSSELTKEGGRTIVVISYNIKAKLNNTFTPCRGSVVFYYQNISGKWELRDLKIYPL